MIRSRGWLVLGALVSMLALAGCGGDDDDDAQGTASGDSQASAVKVVQDAKHGAILASANGAALYTFTQDSPGKSACSGSCAETWPPLEASTPPKVNGATGEFTVLTREDNKKQLALNGRPLYRYAADKPGDVSGDGVGGVWFAAKASGEAPAPGNASGAATPTAGPGSSGDAYGY